jgi:hypothetical protein
MSSTMCALCCARPGSALTFFAGMLVCPACRTGLASGFSPRAVMDRHMADCGGCRDLDDGPEPDIDPA